MKINDVTFEDLYSCPSRNGIYKEEKYHGSGWKIVNMGELFRYDFISNQEMNRVQLTNTEMRAFKLEDGDLLFGRRSLIEDGAGKCSIVINPMESTTFESSIIRVRLDKKKVNPQFLFYYFKSYYGRGRIKAIVSGVNVKGIRGSDLKKIQLSLPYSDIRKQDIVVSTLSDYDDLIDTNRRRIKLLEESARLLFREWFVYFRFPGHEKVKIIDGVPEGWVKGAVGILAKVKSGYAYDSKNWKEEGNPVVKIGNIIGDGTVNLDSCSHIDEDIATKTKDFALIDGELLIAMTGATIGKVGLLTGNVKTAYLNQRVGKFHPKFDGAELLMYCFFMSDMAQTHITNYAGGAAQPNISASQIESIKIIVATRDIYTQFINLVKPMFEKILVLRNQNQKLAQARDLLLPRLMSGAIDPVRYDKLSNGVEI